MKFVVHRGDENIVSKILNDLLSSIHRIKYNISRYSFGSLVVISNRDDWQNYVKPALDKHRILYSMYENKSMKKSELRQIIREEIQILNENKKITFSGGQYQPSDVATDIIDILSNFFRIDFKSFKPHWSNKVDEHGIKLDVRYSSGYMQDPKWSTYITIEFDTKYNNKDIIRVMSLIRKSAK